MRFAILFLATSGVLTGQKLPFDVTGLLSLYRISDPQISPDGKLVAFTAQTLDLAANKGTKHVYVVPVTGGGLPTKISDQGTGNERARWSADGKRLAYISDRGGSAQIWLMDPDGGNQKQITTVSTEAGGVVFTPDGKRLVFTSDVFPDCPDDACNQKKLDDEKNNKVKARVYDALLYRHWNRWQSKQRTHLMVVPVGGGPAKDLTPGPRDVADKYAVSSDSTEICYVMNADEAPAVSTNSDLYAVSIAGGEARKITANPGADEDPQYSPDGKYLAFRSQFRAGYESDRWRLQVLERATGKVTNLTENLDRWVTGYAWHPDSSKIFFTVDDRGRQSIQFMPVTGGASRVAVAGDAHLDDIQFSRDGKTLIHTGASSGHPVEIYRAGSGGGDTVALTKLNDEILNRYQMGKVEELTVEGSEKAQVNSFVVKPPDFRADRKYPVLMLIHGGPQGNWGESWTFRWNAQIFAAAGYVVVMPNPRGSTGYGQKFVDDINGDWGGRAYEDVMAVADKVATLPYVDGERMAAAGGSYGGYLVNWILGHTTRFKALISHAGVYDLRSEMGETEELWFPLWEFKGTPWENPEIYNRWSPSHFAKEFKTPTLVIHGELDFRVPYGQGLQLFTALQLQKVPSRLLIYPDEGHWITKPQNSVLWYKTFIDWINTWTKK